VEIKSIRFFIAVAETGNITRAAEQLGIVQPALTRHINALEEEFGVRMFTRLPRGVNLTAVGREFLVHCRRIVDEIERARHEITAHGSHARGIIALGSTTTLGRVLMPTVVGQCLEELPEISLRVVETRSVKLHEQLLTGALDVALLTNPIGSYQLSMQPLISEPLCLVARPGRLPKQDSLSWAEIAQMPLVTTPGMRALASGDKGQFNRLNVVAEVESIETIRALLISGDAVSIVPKSTFTEDIQAGLLCAVSLTPMRHRMLVLAVRTDKADLPAIRQLARIIRQGVQKTLGGSYVTDAA
jgi:LysR family nitrogen assimilation transcriptional regulator